MALCNPKTLRGIHGVGRKLGLSIDDLRGMTSTGHLSTIRETEAAGLLNNLRAQLPDQQAPACPWRLYSSSTLAREIKKYASEIHWNQPDGFRAWLKKCFKIERLEWVSSLKQATAVKNALKRMYNQQQRELRTGS